MNKTWKCRNAEYLTHFLTEIIGEIAIDTPDEVYKVNDHVEKKVYYANGKKKIIFFEKKGNEIELFTNKTWYLKNMTNGFRSLVCRGFILYYDESFFSKQFIDLVFLEQYIETIAELLKVELKEPIKLYIVHKDVFKNVFGNEDITGFFEPLKGNIYVDCIDVNATHEIVHAIMHEWGLWPHLFCCEGIAESFKKPICFPIERINKLMSFEEMFFAWENLGEELYGTAGLFFRFLFQKYDVDVIKGVCRELKWKNNIDAKFVFHRATGSNNIIKEFITWFEENNWENVDWYYTRNRSNYGSK